MNGPDLSTAAIEADVVALDTQMTALRDKKRELQQEISRRVEMQNALRKSANMTPGELAALAQVIAPTGVASAEAVNGQ